MNRKTQLLSAAIAVGAAFGFCSSAQAALITCPASFTADGTAKVHDGTLDKNTAASDCQYDDATGTSDVANITNINASGFFGFSDWEDNGQTQIDPPVDSSGTWSINDVDFDAFDYIMVFKNGDGTNLIAFLFNEEFASGGWDTPFTEPPFDLPGGSTVHDVSHYTIARRATDGVVPEPGMLGLLGLGVLGLAATRRRKR